MSNDYYNASGWPVTLSFGASVSGRSEMASIAAGFDKMASLTGNASKFIRVNAGETAQEAVDVTGTGNVVLSSAPTITAPVVSGALTVTGLARIGSSTSGNESLLVAAGSGSANDFLTISYAATGSGPTITGSSGAGANVPVRVRSKGTGAILFQSDAAGTPATQLQVSGVTGATRYVIAAGSVSGFASLSGSNGTLEIPSILYASGSIQPAARSDSVSVESISYSGTELNTWRVLNNAKTYAGLAILTNSSTGNTTFTTASSASDAGSVMALIHSPSVTTGIHIKGGTTSENASVFPGSYNLTLGVTGGLGTTAVDGYIAVPSCAGAPTGIPRNVAAGQAVFHYDATNNKIYVFNGTDGTWRSTAVLT